ncbi:nitrogenase-stabilizing/protective protein NifW [Vibrio sp.]|uniref:Nitrogenase-stabilizing/protective protein NifW n=1 Tax=Vibrio viridaestus TaxID=2487322 RepID=A0A3N9U2F3_9VIBR|nr:nitrogenase-stabilizing/protective protein NifW [Vibrio viridaestus]MDC0610985.1 nitrogenase-stabilizing/protective protein NifW [Vibrio sp.]RQW62106.1 hypothetical protein EES38_15425 [Vibrio viridaestus]
MDATLHGHFIDDLEDLETAEDFLNYFNIEFDAKLVRVKRIQLLRMYEKLLSHDADNASYESHKQALCTAYKQITLGRELAFEGGGCHGCTDCSD